MSSSPATARPDSTIAACFVDARRNAGTVANYPGELPQTQSEAYRIQNEAIALWPDKIVGWKVGGINGVWAERLQSTRLVGPVFARNCREDVGGIHDMPVFEQGFAAVEGEVTAVINRDVPAGLSAMSTEEARSLIGALHLGVEIASSPFPEINDHGPLVTITDFGNNNGLILGDTIPDWQALDLGAWTFETRINGVSVGQAVPTGLPGGPLESVRFALENISSRGFAIPKGSLILTGAVTGVHQARIGDEAIVSCAGTSHIHCRLVAAGNA